VHKKLAVSLGASDWRFDQSYAWQSYCSRRRRYFLEHTRMHCWIGDEAASADVPASGLELWLHERHDVSGRCEQRRDDRKNMPQGNKRDVDGHDACAVTKSRQITWLERSRIRTFDHRDARLGPQLPVQLTSAHIDGNHMTRARLEEDVGETASRCADVDRQSACHVDRECLECMRELDATAADPWMFRLGNPDVAVRWDERARFRRRVSDHRDFTAKNERSRFLPRLDETACDEQRIEARLRGSSHD
jgi:hypothetical protein